MLDGLLRKRAALHAAGLIQGFQWLDGSFLEHVENISAGLEKLDYRCSTYLNQKQEPF